jgi:hypothetical protein
VTPRILIGIGVAAAALTVGVPTAFAEGMLAGSQEPSATVAPDAFERAVAARQRNLPVASVPDSHDFGGQGGQAETTYIDAGERALRVGRVQPASTQETPGLFGGDDNVRLDPADIPVSVPTASSGRELEWPQIGIGFGIGIVLALGLLLALRAMRIRPLAH